MKIFFVSYLVPLNSGSSAEPRPKAVCGTVAVARGRRGVVASSVDGRPEVRYLLLFLSFTLKFLLIIHLL